METSNKSLLEKAKNIFGDIVKDAYVMDDSHYEKYIIVEDNRISYDCDVVIEFTNGKKVQFGNKGYGYMHKI